MVKSICGRALYLEKGRPVMFGPASEAVERYSDRVREDVTERALANVAQRGTVPAAGAPSGVRDVGEGSGHGRIESVRLLNERGAPCETFALGERVLVEATVRTEAALNRLDLSFMVRDKAGVDLFGASMIDEGAGIGPIASGERRVVRFSFVNGLAAGAHGVAMTFTRRPDAKGEGLLTLHHMDNAAAFETIGGARAVRGKMRVEVGVEVLRPEPQQAGV
jgi:hypothetical protein